MISLFRSVPRLLAGLMLVPAVLALCSAAPANGRQEPAGEPLVIGTKEAAPFSFRGADGAWQGVSVDLWKLVAEDLGLEFEFREAPLEDLVTGLTDGRFDASVAALTITPEREEILDFAHAFYPSGLGIAVSGEEESGFLGLLASLLTVQFWRAVGTLVVILFCGGAVVWLAERSENEEQFGGTALEGLGSAFWWSAVTMTTVGYGDKAPVTRLGRTVGVIWMFAGVITISGLTAAIASTLTLSRLEHSVTGPGDLPDLGRIACVAGSTGESYLISERLNAQAFETAEEAVQSLVDGASRAVVYDEPILRYLALGPFAGEMRVLPVTFEKQDYAFALPLSSTLRKEINRSLLGHVSGEGWEAIRYRYLGAPE